MIGRAALERLSATLLRRRRPPLPRVTVEVGHAVPAWVLRIVAGVVALGCVHAVAAHGALWLAGAVLAVGVVVRPGGPASLLLAAGAGLVLLAREMEPFHPRVFLLLFALHLVIELGALLGDLPAAARVEVAAVAGSAVPFFAIQAFVQFLAVLGGWITVQDPVAPWVPLVAGTALAVLAWTLLHRIQLEP